MKKSRFILIALIIIISGRFSFAQSQSERFKMEGDSDVALTIKETYTESTEILPFDENSTKIYGMSISADIAFESEESTVRLVLVDKNFKEYLIYETYPLLEPASGFSVDDICEETSILNGVHASSLKLEIIDATVTLNSISYATIITPGLNVEKIRKEKKEAQNEEKIARINQNLKQRGAHWIAGPTTVSELTYEERKHLYGQSTFPAGFEFYVGGVISSVSDSESVSTLKSATASSQYIDNWDWRDRHGKNWITSIKDQEACGSCWAFATTGATEAMANLYYNQILELDLAEQDVLSCTGFGDCTGGAPAYALDYISNTGIVDEGAFPYSAADQPCNEKSNYPSELIKIGGRTDFGSSAYPKTEDVLKKMLIEMGPLSGGLYDWSHAMTLVGYKVVKEGDRLYYRDLEKSRYWITVSAGDPLIGKTVWIFKNSWDIYFGDYGYVYVETPITNIGWTHALKTPVVSTINNYDVVCEDADGDGYYWWGLGEKPATCNGPDQPDGDDSDPNLGPLDEYGYCIVLSNNTVANFSADNTTITDGETVTFTDLSTNNPTSWSWSFAGGTPETSTTQNPAVTYDVPGTYDVTLTATNASGSDSKTVSGYITVKDGSPVAEFTADNTTITEGETITFTDLSTNKPTSWSWSFTGGTPATSTSQNPIVTYDVPGTYDVMLTAINSYGSDSKTVSGFVTVKDGSPVAEFTANNTTITEGENITFTDLSTNKPTSWSWSFTGGTPATSTSQNPVVTYDVPGTYDVTLKVINSVGTDSKTVSGYITVKDGSPVAEFTADNTTVIEGETVTFSDLSTNSPTSWLWSFAGGTPATSNLQNPTVTYNTPGTHEVTLTVENAFGTDSKIKTGYITIEEYVVPVPTYCTSSGNAADEWIASVRLGDNNHSSGSEGYGDFTSVVFDLVFGENYSIALEPGHISRSKFEYWAVWIDFNGDFDFEDSGEQVFVSSKDKSIVTGQITIPSIGTLDQFDTRMRVAMSNNGVPPVCGPLGYGEVEDYTLHIVQPESLPPVAEFTASGTLIQAGESVQFTDLSENGPTKWQWSFPGGNPSSSIEKNPTVTYSAVGEYDVTLVVSKDGFESSQKIKQKFIKASEIAPVSYCEPVAINSSADYIQNFALGNEFSAASAGQGFTLSSNVISMVAGQSYNTTLVPFDSKNRNFWRVWIDFNQDGDFDDSDETLVVENNQRGNVNTHMTIPAYAVGITRMRISMKNDKSPAACDDYFNGEVEDYMVTFESQAAKFASSSPIEPEIIDLRCHFYPNPVFNKLNFALDEFEAGDSYLIYNSQGELIIEDKIESDITTVNFESYSPGIYLITVRNKGNLFREKIIKK